MDGYRGSCQLDGRRLWLRKWPSPRQRTSYRGRYEPLSSHRDGTLDELHTGNSLPKPPANSRATCTEKLLRHRPPLVNGVLFWRATSLSSGDCGISLLGIRQALSPSRSAFAAGRNSSSRSSSLIRGTVGPMKMRRRRLHVLGREKKNS